MTCLLSFQVICNNQTFCTMFHCTVDPFDIITPTINPLLSKKKMSKINSFLTSFGFSDFIYLSLLFALFYVIKFYYDYLTRSNPLPGPIPLPFIGNLLQTTCGFDEFHLKNFRKYGNLFEWYFGNYRVVELCKADLRIFLP